MVAWLNLKTTYMLFFCWLSLNIITSGHLFDNEVHSSFVQRRLKNHERYEIQREILSILGLQHRPKPHLQERKTSAPLFMMNLYNAMAVAEENEDGFSYVDKPFPEFSAEATPLASFQERKFLLNTNLVMSFVNLVEHDLEINQKWYRKEFKFDLNEIPKEEQIISAEFCLYKDHVKMKETFQISIYQVLELYPDGNPDLLELDSQIIGGSVKGWLTFDITSASVQWVFNPDSNLGLQISVDSLDGRSVSPHSIGVIGRNGSQDKQPFMVTFFKSSEVHLRRLRSTSRVRHQERAKTFKESENLPLPNVSESFMSSSAGRRDSCKKHELYVSFRDLGWQDWIIAPEGYAAFYCDGDCAFPLNAHMNATNHAIVQTLVNVISPSTVPRPCCVPTKLIDITVLFFDDNSNVILKKYKNMVVKSCGCQ